MLGAPESATPGEWAERGACRGYPTAWWYPTYDHYTGNPQKEAQADAAVATRICAELCPVRAECLIHALRHREVGIWGATSDQQRREMRKGWRAA